MITIGGTQHQQPVTGVAWLAELQLASGTLRLTTAPIDITLGGYTWQGIGQLGDVSPVAETADTDGQQITLSLSVVNTAMLAAALGDPADYRGRTVRLHLALLDAQFVPQGTPTLRWAGVMNKLSIRREAGSGDDAAQGSIELLCMRRGMDRARHNEGLRLTHQQQQERFPGDTGLRYVRTLIEQPSLWLSKKFQER